MVHDGKAVFLTVRSDIRATTCWACESKISRITKELHSVNLNILYLKEKSVLIQNNYKYINITDKYD